MENIYIEQQRDRWRHANKIIKDMRDIYVSDGVKKDDIRVMAEKKEALTKDKVNGYSSFQIIIDETLLDSSVKYLKSILNQKKFEIAKEGLVPKCTYGEYIAYDEDGEEIVPKEGQTKLLAFNFILELNDGDYEIIGRLLSDAEEEGMRKMKSARELYKTDREEQTGHEHFVPGKPVIKR